MTEMPLAGQVAFITGGGGIARAVAAELLRDGAAVLLMDRDATALDEARAALQSHDTLRNSIDVYAGNAGEPGDVRAALAAAHALRGRLDIVVATVGGGAFMPVLMHDSDSFRRQIDLNVMTAFLAIRYGVPLMATGGSIVCISSTVAKLPFAGLSAYCTGKGALEQLVRTAADELSGAGVRVNAVRPGVTRTEMARSMIETPEIARAFLDQIPLERFGEAAEVARAVRFLAGPESGWITGQSMAVDGGNELRRNPDLAWLVESMFGSDATAAAQR